MSIMAWLENSRLEDGSHCLISYGPSDAGFAPDGSFDFEIWEDAQIYISAVPGVDLRIAWKEAHQHLRLIAREHGGLEWCSSFIPGEAVALPDRAIL